MSESELIDFVIVKHLCMKVSLCRERMHFYLDVYLAVAEIFECWGETNISKTINV